MVVARNNRSMKSSAPYFLILPLAVLLTLPPGWCCTLLNTGCCQQRGEQAASQTKTSTPLSENVCCCETTPGKKSPGSTKPRPPIPSQPEPCCVEVPRTHTQSVSHFTFDGDDAVCEVLVIPQLPITARPFTESVVHPYLTYRIHLIQCVWLC